MNYQQPAQDLADYGRPEIPLRDRMQAGPEGLLNVPYRVPNDNLQFVARQDRNPPVQFEFRPMDWVWVTAFGVNYRGRVTFVEWRQNDVKRYSVEYLTDRGEFETDLFQADELKPADPKDFKP